MAERNVSVRLSANVASYTRAMDQARASTGKLQQEAGRDMAKLGGKMQDVGKMATVGITLPLVGIGAGAVKMSNNFNASMSKIVGLVGLSADEVDGMKESVLGLAGETARSPQELADALFVVTSAGLRGEEAMSALEMSAKASAAGMGETKDIARALASAVNTYGSDVLSAAHATDVLTATARAGNFETSELAGSLGKVLPFAKQAQASFEDVGGAIALLTRGGVSASESITQVQALMRSFVVPTAEAATILGDLGMSAEDVRDSMGENGLVATIQMLDDKLGGNREQLGRLIGSSEGASVAYQILDADAATLAGTFGVTAEAAGMTGEAFSAAADTDAFKMQQAMERLSVAMIEIGSIIAPIAADIAGGIADMASAFSDLDPTVQKIIIGIAGTAAAAGPLLIVTGSLIKNYTLLKTAMAGSNVTMAGSAAKMGLLAKAAAATAVAYASLAPAVEGLRGNTDFVYKDLQGIENVLLPMQQLGKLMYSLGGGTESAASQWSKFEEEAAGAFASMTSGVYTMEQLRDRLNESSLSIDARNLISIAFKKQLDATAEAEANLAEATGQTTTATEGWSGVARQATLTANAQEQATKDNAEAQTELEEETDAAAESAARIEAQADQTAKAMDEWSQFTDALTASHEAMIDEVLGSLSGMFDYEQAVLDLDNAYSGYQTAVEDAMAVLEDSESTDRDKAEALRNLRGEELELAEKVYATASAYAEEQGALEGSAEWAAIMRGRLEEQAGAYPELRDEIDLLIDGLNRIPRNISSSVDITTYYRQVGSSTTPVRPDGGPRALGGPTYQGKFHEVTENGSELLYENGRTYLMAAANGFVTPLPAAAPSTSSTWGSDTAGPITLIIEGQPLTAIVQRSEAQLAAELRGGVR